MKPRPDQSQKKVAAKLLVHSKKIDISTWSLDAVEPFKKELEKVAYAAANEALALAVTDDAFAWFPHEFNFDDVDRPDDGINGPMPGDTMTIYISLPFGPDDGDWPTWGVSLRDIVERMLDRAQSGDGHIHAQNAKGVVAIREGLRDLVKKIDDATKGI